MDPRKISELASFFKERALFPKRSLSQNFLIDKNVLEKIAKEAEIVEGETVLEIGSGPGGLTKTLLEKNCKVIAVETDRRFTALLREILPEENLTIVEGDFLEYPLIGPIKIVGNIPYHISSAILEKLCNSSKECSRVTLVMQKDLADRIIQKPPFRNATFLSYYLHFHFTFTKGFAISPNCFWPAPKVFSYALSLVPKQVLPSVDKEAFFAFLAPLFQKRRKMLSSLLKNSSVEKVLIEMGFSPKARPEELSLEQFLKLFLSLFIN
ncbi:MAG: ribosomal RNA small subunit methyltransferase A [Verrucomicrobia bacterium]|nr:ribosomal RNA small subunit methyltransferase A [Verrucomicrobiota bacterium]